MSQESAVQAFEVLCTCIKALTKTQVSDSGSLGPLVIPQGGMALLGYSSVYPCGKSCSNI